LPAKEFYPTISLKDLQHKIAGGDETAFAQLYFQFAKKLLQFAISLVRSKEISEELVEDVFVKLWTGRQHITGIENLNVYLYIAVKNTALNRLSKKAKELISGPFDYLDLHVDEFAADPYDLMITSEMMASLHQVIENLPPRCKMIFKLIREDGLKYKEVGEILNISVNTIDAQMAIAVKKLCSALQLKNPRKFQHLPGEKKED